MLNESPVKEHFIVLELGSSELQLYSAMNLVKRTDDLNDDSFSAGNADADKNRLDLAPNILLVALK